VDAIFWCWSDRRIFFEEGLAQAANTCMQQTVVSWHVSSHCALGVVEGSL
jgi:hypothetical protein